MEPIRADDHDSLLLEPELIQMNPEQRMILSMILQAIAEQDPLNVVIPNPPKGTPLPTRGQKRIAAEAQRFCKSDEYLRLCRLVHFDPKRKARPDSAKTALALVGFLRGTEKAQSLTLMERRCRQVENQRPQRKAAPELEEIAT